MSEANAPPTGATRPLEPADLASTPMPLTGQPQPQPLLVRGSAQNFKVTYPEDFALAEAILNSRNA